MPGALVIRDLDVTERAWANDVYRAIRFALTPPDAVALVAELDERKRVGLGRLVALAPDVLELGGIWTDETVRGRGVARAMVNALLVRAETLRVGQLWCIPFTHLAPFYRSFGFAISAPPWPPEIAAKVAHCIEDRLPPVDVLRLAIAQG